MLFFVSMQGTTLRTPLWFLGFIFLQDMLLMP